MEEAEASGRVARFSDTPLHELSAEGFTGLNFSLERWSLWCPGASLPEYPWPLGSLIPVGSEKEALDFLPIMQRRRLSPMARAAMAVAWPCGQGVPSMPAVFYSRHGESASYLDTLHDLAAGNELSPSRFSLSVHNAIAGLYSLCSGSEAPSISLAGSGDDLFGAFLEAAGILSEGDFDRVLLVLYEQPLPASYSVFAQGPGRIVALGLRLGAPRGGPRLHLRRKPPRDAASGCQVERLCDAVMDGARQSDAGSLWQWNLTDG